MPENARPEGFSDSWISERTGIQERRLIAPWGSDSLDLDHALPAQELALATSAALTALKDAGTSISEISGIVTLRSFSRPELPSLSQKLLSALGTKNIPTLDLSQASTGVPLAFELIHGLNWASTGPVLLVIPEILSPYLSASDPHTAILFGDAAAACVLRKNTTGRYRVLKTTFECSGDPTGVLKLDRYFSMRGKELFRYAIPALTQSARKVVEKKANWYLPHQANARIMHRAAKSMDYTQEQILSSIANFGNTSSASTLLTLALEEKKKVFKQGETILINTCGSGLSHGSALLEVTK